MGPTNLHALPSATTPLDVAATLAGRTVLVTGVTGFVGKVWLSQVLHDLPDVGRIYVLARPGDAGTAAERFTRIAERSPAFRPLRERHGARLGAFLGARVEVLEGDVSKPQCGLDDATVARLAPELDAIVHFAGLTDFDPDPRLAFETNVLGAAHIADLAAATEHATLLHCSTCFVAGIQGGHVSEEITPGVSPSQRAFDVDAEVAALAEIAARPGHKRERVAAARERAQALGWPNIYTFTKGLAEHLLAQRPVELTLLRPAIVECALDYPFTGWNEGINTTGPLLWLLRSPFRHFPAREDVHYDVVPVDAVTRAATSVLAAALEGTAAPVYQVSSSCSNPMTMGRGIELANLAIRKDLASSKASRFQRFVVKNLDTVAVDADKEHAFALPRLQRYAKGVQGFLGGLDLKAVLPPAAYKVVGKPLERHKDTAGFLLEHAHRSFGRIQRMLDLFRPFIHDTDWIFVNDHIRALDLRLSDASRARFGWIVDDIDWRDYWLRVLYPGLDTWCMPRLEGADIPEDPPMSPPLTLVTADRLDTAAPGDADAQLGAS
ncbi:MAG: NAD-dependent epimerase/dehydratase family protein [Deltaproteobacteria bacterium]|nr:MAG: NAD-dependent epimerase/dehydratase family protein [Deltaproteobacteria bacterium]